MLYLRLSKNHYQVRRYTPNRGGSRYEIFCRNSLLWLFLFFCFSVFGQTRYEFSHPQMGTVFKIILYTNDSLSGVYASQKAFLRLDSLNLILSDYREDSEINRLCRTSGTSQFVKVSNDLWNIMQESIKAAKLTNGYFDVTIGSMTQLWRRMKRQKILPSQHQIEEARAKVGIKNIFQNADNQSIMLDKKGIRIDFGGIGKGFAEDEMIKILKENGIKSAMIEAGGNIVVSESPIDSPEGWEIIINGKKHFFKNCGISTSGDTYQFVEINGKQYSHILDPKTGIGFTKSKQISVITNNGISSDWLSTALYLMPKRLGRKLKTLMSKSIL
jgi:FAD:protein FMN transferase